MIKKQIVCAALLCGIALFSAQASVPSASETKAHNSTHYAAALVAHIKNANFVTAADDVFRQLMDKGITPIISQPDFDVDGASLKIKDELLSFNQWLDREIARNGEILERTNSSSSRPGSKEEQELRKRRIYVARLKVVRAAAVAKRSSESADEDLSLGISDQGANGQGSFFSQMLNNKRMWMVGGALIALASYLVWERYFSKSAKKTSNQKKSTQGR